MRGIKRRPRPRRVPRHARDGEAVTEALAAVPEPDRSLNLEVPAAQEEAVKAASGPQAVLPGWPHDPPLSWPQGQHPYGPPASNGHPGSMQRPYAPASRAPGAPTPPRILSPVHDKTLLRFRPGTRAVRRHGLAVAHRAQALDYPPPGLAAVAGHGAYAGVMAHADRITGTSGTGQFRPALTAGDAS